MKNRFVAILVLFLLSTAALAQKNLVKANKLFDLNLFQEAIPYYEKAQSEIRDRDLREEARLKLADCHRLLGNFEEAEELYEKLYKRNRRRGNPDLFLSYGKALKASAKYEEAKAIFKEYVEKVPEDPMGPIYVESCDLAQQWLYESLGQEVRNMRNWNSEAPDFAPNFFGNQLVFTSSREGSKKKLISLNPNNVELMLDLYIANRFGQQNGIEPAINFEGINTHLHEGPACLSPNKQEIFFTRTIVGKRDKKNKSDVVLNTLQIFRSEKDSTGNWKEAVNDFPLNSTKYSVAHPSLSADGKYLYFMSDMPGGYGKTDIYRVKRINKTEWGEPENLGPDVNTFGFEVYPVIHESGTLYFSSNTHPGMGKLDVFSAEQENGKFGNVQNMKPPINSIGDDFGLVLDESEKKGFFSSDRFNGLGRDDIYSYMEEYPLNIVINGSRFELEDLTLYAGIDYSVKNKQTEEEVPVYYDEGKFWFELPQEGENYTLTMRKQGFPFNKVDLSIERNTKENYLVVNSKSKFKPVQYSGFLTEREIITGVKFVEKPNPIDTITTPIIDTVYVSDTLFHPITGAKVYLSAASSDVADTLTDLSGYFTLSSACNPMRSYTIKAPVGERKILDPFVHYKGKVTLNGAPVADVKLELTYKNGEQAAYYTKADGSYYFKLGAKEAFELAASKIGFKTNSLAISENQYQAGDTVDFRLNMAKKEMVPVVGTILDEDSNLLPNTLVTLTNEGKILGQSKTNEKGEFTFSLLSGEEYNVVAAKQGYISNERLIDKSQTDPSGKFKFSLEKDQNYTISAIKPGYIPAEQEVSTKELTSNEPIELNITLEKIKKDKTVRIDNIYYDFNATVFNVSALPELAKLIDFLNLNPTVKIELASHTDARGKEDYNFKLSQQRANKVVLFLHLEGIDKDRIVAKGYGESSPLNDCVDGIDCPEEKHQENRRTEFKILSY